MYNLIVKICITLMFEIYEEKERKKTMSERVIAIEGGYKLNGTVRISGAKNATVAPVSYTHLVIVHV